MSRPPKGQPEPIEAAIERAFQPGRFIDDRSNWDFVAGLEGLAAKVEKLTAKAPKRAVDIYETLLAGCYEKAEELDDSSGRFGMFVQDLYCGWIKARQAAGTDPSNTAERLVARMDDDPYGFAYDLERDAVKALDRAGLDAFTRTVRARFDGKGGSGQKPEHSRRHWGKVLRAIHLHRRSVTAYVALGEETELTADDCLALATMLRGRKPEDALSWTERGLVVAKERPHGMAEHDLRKMRRALLSKVGRSDQAVQDAWEEHHGHPHKFGYEELMRLVPKKERAAWHSKAMGAAKAGDLGSAIELFLAVKETNCLLVRLRGVSDADLEGVSHYHLEPAAKHLAKSHPDVAAKAYRALGKRILNAKKSKYYGAAIRNFADAKVCYERAGLERQWQALVAEVRSAHARKQGFIAEFERLVSDEASKPTPSFLGRARSRWSKGTGE